MKKIFLFKWLNDVSIAKKLYFTVGIMALLIGIELFALFFSINTLSSVRAYVEGESLWSKAQKDAVYHLFRYGTTRDEKDYNRFKEFMNVPLGDAKARKELMKPNPDLVTARQGFIEGRNHPDDVDGMIKLFRRFSSISYISKAIYYWGEAEPIALEFIPIADSLHIEVNTATPSQERINILLSRIIPLTEKITKPEDNFSYTLGEGSRWLENLVLTLLFIIALSVEISGLLLAFSVSRGIQKGLSEIISASGSFAMGNLGIRARVFSKDEIGVLANSFNNMSDDLERNITELAHAEKKFKALIESAPDAIIILNKDGKIKIVNAQTEKLFGYDRNDLLSNEVDMLIGSKSKGEDIERGRQFFEFPKASGLTLNLFGKKKNKLEFPIEINLVPLQTEEGLLLSIAIRDISERKYIKELESKNKELEQFAFIASHDLLEPLNTISSFIGLLEEEHKHKLDKEGNAYISYIKKSADRMTLLITDILDYSRIGEKSHFEIVDCNKIVNLVIEDMNSTILDAKAEIEVGNLPTLKSYSIEIRLLFQNLLSNAIKFRKKDVPSRIKIQAKKKNQNWHFSVEDNGIGIDEKYKEKIFVIFQRLHHTRDFEGTGIGLAHCKKIVELLNGKIWVKSELGIGSKFYFTLPVTN